MKRYWYFRGKFPSHLLKALFPFHRMCVSCPDLKSLDAYSSKKNEQDRQENLRYSPARRKASFSFTDFPFRNSYSSARHQECHTRYSTSDPKLRCFPSRVFERSRSSTCCPGLGDPYNP